MFKLIRKIFVIVILVLLVATLSSRMEAGLGKIGFKIGNVEGTTVQR